MVPLTARDVIRIWEQCERDGTVEQALTILAAACPDQTQEQLADLSLGERDRRLFQLRQRLFGPLVRGFVQCPACRERLEFDLDLSENLDAPRDVAPGKLTMSTSGFEIRFRPPSSRDFIIAATCPGPQRARQLLIECCVEAAYRDGMAIPSYELPETVLAEMAARILAVDPLQEVLVDLSCPACDHRWQSLFDIGAFFWEELADLAQRLLREVHLLARAYGWREADILAMSTRRRRAYLDLVTL